MIKTRAYIPPMPRIILLFFLVINAWGQAPGITERPLSRVLLRGESTSISIAATGTSPLSYVWKHNGTQLVETTSTLQIDNASLADRGWYHVTVSNAAGKSTSVFYLGVAIPDPTYVSWGEYAVTFPNPLDNIADLATGFDSLTVLALQSDGSVLSSGSNSQGQGDVPVDLGPVVRIATNGSRSAAVTASGQVAEWPARGEILANLSDVVDVKIGHNYGLALKADGTVVSWGDNWSGQRNLPDNLNDVVAIAAGRGHGAVLLSDGTVRVWGGTSDGSGSVPLGLEKVTAISSGGNFLVALREDGTITAWGQNYNSSTTVPDDLPPVSAITSGANFNVAIHPDGRVSAFGSNYNDETDVPPFLSGAVHVFAGVRFGGALLESVAPQVSVSPESKDLTAGDDLILTVKPTGALFFDFQWYRDNEALTDGNGTEGTTTHELYIRKIDAIQAGLYTVKITNAIGAITSPAAAVTVAIPPSITSHPLSQLVGLGADATFSISVAETAGVTYVWKHNSRVIPSAVSPSLSLTNFTRNDSGYYEVIVSNSEASVSSVFNVFPATKSADQSMVVTWSNDPTQPQSTVLSERSDIVKLAVSGNHILALTASGSVTSLRGNPAPSSLANVVDIAIGSFSAALTADGRIHTWERNAGSSWNTAERLTNVSTLHSNGGNLAFVKSDGSVQSLHGLTPSGVTGAIEAVSGFDGLHALRPDGTVAFPGEEPDYSVYDFRSRPDDLTNIVDLDAAEWHYLALRNDATVIAWGRNDLGQSDVPRGLENVMMVEAADRLSFALHTDGGVTGWGFNQNYNLQSPNRLGSVLTLEASENSHAAIVAVGPPQTLQSPVNTAVNTGDALVLSAKIVSGVPATYQWFKDNVAIAGATDLSLHLDASTGDDSGSYTLVATNAYGTATSTAAQVSIVTPVSISSRPLSRMIAAGDSTTFTITASGQGSLQYAWRHDGQPISGANGSSLELTNVTRADRGRYTVMVSDDSGGTALSVVYIEVAPPVGGVLSWGHQNFAPPPAPFNYVAIDASDSGGTALRTDGTVADWGYNTYPPPAELNGVVAVARGNAHNVALKSDGTVTVWGSPGYSDTNAPEDLDEVVAISASGFNIIALRADGTVVIWGYDPYPKQVLPSNLNRIVSIAAGDFYGVALRYDGSVTTWGNPMINLPSDVVRIAAGSVKTAMERGNGEIEIWHSRLESTTPSNGLQHLSVGSNLALMLEKDDTLKSVGSYEVDPVIFTTNGILDLAVGNSFYALLVADEPSAPEIITPPADQTTPYGASVTFDVEISGSPPFTFRWLKNGTPITNDTNTSPLVLTDVKPEDAGLYSIEVRNGFGQVTSATAGLTVETTRVTAMTPPVVGGSVTLTVNAPEATAYQWRYRGEPIDNATEPTLTLTDLSRINNGLYDVVLTATDNATTVAHGLHLDVSPVNLPDIYVAASEFAPRFEQAGTGTVNAVLALPDGGFLVAGDFVRINETERSYLARFNADLSLDSSSTLPTFSEPVHALTTDAEGRIYVGGDFSFVDGQSSPGLVRLTPTLEVDPTFSVGRGFDGSLYALAIQSDGKIIAGGNFTWYDGDYRRNLIRLNLDATFDPTLSYSNSIGAVHCIRLQPDGKVIAAGGQNGNGINTSPEGFITRLTPTEGTDWIWGDGSRFSSGVISLNWPVLQLEPISGGGWLAAGGKNDHPSDGRMLRIESDGPTHSDFALADSITESARRIDLVKELSDGRFLIVGPGLPPHLINADGSSAGALSSNPWLDGSSTVSTIDTGGQIRLWGDGGYETGFTAPLLGSATINSTATSFEEFTGHTVYSSAPLHHVAQVSNEHLLVRGGFTHVNGQPREGLAQISMTGELDVTFAADIALPLADTGRMLRLNDGRTLVHDGSRLRRLAANGSEDSGFVSPQYSPGAIAIGPSGNVLVSNTAHGGYFGSTYGLIRLLAHGGIDPTFTTDFTGQVQDIFPQSNGRIVLGGYFSQFENTSVNGIQRIFANGEWDPSFKTSYLSSNTIIPASDDRFYQFENSNSSGRSIRRILENGINDLDFNRIDYPQPEAVTLLPDDRFIVSFSGHNDPTAEVPAILHRYLEDGAPDTAFQIDGLDPRRSIINQITLTDEGSLIIIGSSFSAFGEPRSGLIKLDPATLLSIVTPPVTTSATVGEDVTLIVVAAGTGPITYQWYRNRVAITGATASSLELPEASLSDVADYHVVVTHPFGTISSDPVTVTGPNPAPTITSQPESIITHAGHAAKLSVTATGVGELTYQWRKSSYPIPDATEASFEIPHSLRSDAGLYDVIVADGLSTITSTGVRIDVSPTSYPSTLAIDPSFAPRFEAPDGEINTILPAADGKFIVTGDFTSLNGISSPGIARVDADFEVDPSFNPPSLFGHVGSSFAYQVAQTRVMAIQPDGKVLVLHALPGDSVSAHRNTLKRLLPNGLIDSTFNASVEPVNINDLALQPDGKIIVVGLEISSSPIGDKHYVYRLNSDGTHDESYAPQFQSQGRVIPPSNVVAQPNGQAVFAGYFDTINDTAVNGFIRLNSDGSLDPDFASSDFSVGYTFSMEIDPSGSIWIGGPVYHSSAGTLYLSRFSPDGTWEAGWGSRQDISRGVASIQFGSDGKIWAAQRPHSNSVRAARISADDSLEQTFESYYLGDSVAFVPRVNGGLWMTGNVVNQPGPAVREFAPDGTPGDFFVSTMASAAVTTLAQAPDGSFYAAGDFTHVNDVASGRIARLFSNGELDPSFVAPIGFDSSPTDLEPLPNGQLFVGGQFNHYEGRPIAELVRLNADGTRDPTFAAAEPTNSSTWFNSPVALLSDGRLLVRADICFLSDGSFDPTHSLSYSNSLGIHALPNGEALLALSTDAIGTSSITQVDPTGSQLKVGYAYHTFNSFAVDPLGRILSGNRYQNDLQNLVKRLLPDLSLDDSFEVSGLPDPIYNTSSYTGPTLLVQENGQVIVNDINGMWRLNTDGSRDTSFSQEVVTDIGGLRNTPAAAMLLLDDGRLLIADQEMQVNGLHHRGIVALRSVDGATINQQPISQVLVVGETLTLSPTLADSAGLSFQWSKDGIPIANATVLNFQLNDIQPSDAGQYTLAITGPAGTTHSAAAQVTIDPPVAPQIQLQPHDQSGEISGNVSFRINATGRPAPTFQWQHNGNNLLGETGSTLQLENLTADAAGAYTVIVTNLAGSVTSEAAELNLFPSGTTARQEITDTELRTTLATVTITNTVTSEEPLPHLDWQVLLPSGWSLQSTTGDAEASRPTVGATALLEWSWSAIPASPLIFTYTLEGSLSGNLEPEIATLLTIGTGENAIQYLAQPDPLVLRFRHSADTDQDNKISLGELLRVIELYNTRFGTSRTGRYRDQSDSPDGFATDPALPGDTPAAHSRYHTADIDRDGKISLGELLRVIELYNTRSGTSRTGRYRIQPDSEDGFAPMP